MSDLALEEDDEDFHGLIQHCTELNATSSALTEIICKEILQQCGGHAYPTLAFIEHFFRPADNADMTAISKALSCPVGFHVYFGGEEFAQSRFQHDVRGRCFDELLDEDTVQIACRVFRGEEERGDVGALDSLGWWNRDKRGFISPFLRNAVLCAESGIPR